MRHERSRAGRRSAWALSLLGLTAVGAQAQSEDDRPASHLDERTPGHHRPPPEAFRACEGKSEGAACQVMFRDTTLDGTCVSPAKEELFCVPNDMPPPPDGPPPRR